MTLSLQSGLLYPTNYAAQWTHSYSNRGEYLCKSLSTAEITLQLSTSWEAGNRSQYVSKWGKRMHYTQYIGMAEWKFDHLIYCTSCTRDRSRYSLHKSRLQVSCVVWTVLFTLLISILLTRVRAWCTVSGRATHRIHIFSSALLRLWYWGQELRLPTPAEHVNNPRHKHVQPLYLTSYSTCSISAVLHTSTCNT